MEDVPDPAKTRHDLDLDKGDPNAEREARLTAPFRGRLATGWVDAVAVR